MYRHIHHDVDVHKKFKSSRNLVLASQVLSKGKLVLGPVDDTCYRWTKSYGHWHSVHQPEQVNFPYGDEAVFHLKPDGYETKACIYYPNFRETKAYIVITKGPCSKFERIIMSTVRVPSVRQHEIRVATQFVNSTSRKTRAMSSYPSLAH